mmetsp:Transcript_33174/g.78375  ORF Transcript_33174/g.78375 Transcript_33174/m.78375 type:complete len:172 (+) Transcript_33174:17-532(+)|eukprot:CAMPEP_0172367070 /NCGR_PEP_ID=MMETSP1060-20121228/18754_1 /TAXON_ID=37318 /ORGANISM="Pseudo-nitzschia pungens, Strain cf. cingulata" /LENGTH=171 /DNA_ID=CAMNT_0013091153 /DNA_START=99 /DNA_END=614 /DNA_ORIENTATION=-
MAEVSDEKTPDILEGGDDDSFGDEIPPALFKMTSVDTSLDDVVLEECVKKAFERDDKIKVSISVMGSDGEDDVEEGDVFFLCSEDGFDADGDGKKMTELLLKRMRDYLEQKPEEDVAWITDFEKASIEVVDWEADEPVLDITEEEAYQHWLEQNDGDNSNIEPQFGNKSSD